MSGHKRADLETAIAIVGLAGRFPGARNSDELWQLLASGREAIRPLSRQEAAAQGATEAELADPSFVRVVARPEGIEDFDAPFFGFNPREAEILDPQQRFLLEVAWEAIEDAGYDPLAVPGLTGVFAGATTSTYLLFHLLPNGELRRAVDPLELLVGNAADSLATRLSFKFNLEGPSYSIASACSSSLVAVHNACQSLFQEECDVAVVGGVSINLSHSAGYRHTPQSILSPDGHCRAFSNEAAGTVFGSGIGVVVLKRAVDAVRDGDPIRALILGSSLNNDGAGKVGYTAPAVDGQAAVIAEALGAAGISARDLSYIEAHGTGTRLGDPIEIQAIRRAFRADTQDRGFCGIGSIKTNLGHLDIAAGVAGLIKTVLALEHQQLPPSLHFETPNPEIDFASSPVYVVKELQPWESPNGPRRAGVSSFGIGGTNAHVVLEEAPVPAPSSPPSRPLQVLPLSAKTDTALAAAAERLARFLSSRPELQLADVAFTLQEGRHSFPRRRAVVASTVAEALELLTSSTPLAIAPSAQGGEEAELARRFVAGESVSWAPLRAAGERRRRLSLPPYSFDRHRYWIEAPKAGEWVRAEATSSLPLTASLHPRPPLETPFVAPRDAEEETLAALWRELLGLAEVGANDNFFELGGHSLLGTRLLARLRADQGVELSLDTLFEAPTLAELARRVASARPASAENPAPRSPFRRTDGPPVASLAQERLWFIDRLEPGNPVYNEARALRLLGRLPPRGVEALAASLSAIVERHQALRTTFTEVAGEPRARLAHHVRVRVPVVDVSGVERPARGSRPEERPARRPAQRTGPDQRPAQGPAVSEECFARVAFDLGRAPLLRVCLLRSSEADHEVLFAIHHIAADGWSMGVLVAELAALYPAFLAGEPPHLAPLPIQYSDYATWQRSELSSERLAAELAAVQAQLAGAPTVLEVPTDHPRPAQASPDGAVVPVDIGRELSVRVSELARRENATPFMVLATAFAALLGRLSGQAELLLATPVANRRHPELEGLIGFFVNTLVVRARTGQGRGETPSWRELLAEVKAGSLFAFAHQDLPFDRLVEVMSSDRDLSRPPLVQALLGLHNVPAPSLELPGLVLHPQPLHPGTAKFELNLSLTETVEGLSGELEFAAALFDATTARRWVRAFESLLEAFVAAPEAPVAKTPWLSNAERHQLREWNDTARPYPRGVVLDGLILEQAARTPEAVALWFEDEALSYGALAQLSGEIAAELVARGVGPGVPVGVRAERSLLLPVELLAVLRAGGAYVPLDPELPEARLSGMVEDARVAVRLAGGLCEGRAGEASSTPRDEADPAYIIFTSGSTGRPKGAANTHAGIVNRLLWMQEQYGLGTGDRVLQKTPASFDVSVWEFFWPLLSGACLVVAKPGGHRDSGYLARTIAEHRITTLHFVPSMLQAFLEEPDLTGTDAVRRVIASGEALPGELASRAAGRFAAPLWNLYGPTEAAVDVTYELAPRTGSGAVPIGRPVANTQVVVLDRALLPCPIGVPGELYLGGIQVGGGYLGRPALTAERFVPDTLTGARGRRLYKTGDRVRQLADGRLDFLGRLDFQVKVRGQRIELGEIEAALLSHPDIAEARVKVVGEGVESRLVAYFVRRDSPLDEGRRGDACVARLAAGTTPDQRATHASPLQHPDTFRSVGAGLVPALPVPALPGPALPGPNEPGRPQGSPLREFLAARLPEVMIPAVWMELESFPRTASGKVDLNALPEPARGEGLAAGDSDAPPRGRIEAAVAAVWAEVLGLPAVGAQQNFFELGGHSLLLPKVLVRLKETLPGDRSARLTLIDLFRHPTVRSLARALAPHGEEPESLARGRERALARRQALAGDDVRIAIIGLAGRFPGAPDPAALWELVAAGREGIHFPTDEELLDQGVSRETLADPQFVKATALPEGVELFDASFFGFSAREAEILDPQQRLLLELAWEALENAGYEPASVAASTGVFAGAATSTYLLYNLLPNLLLSNGSGEGLAPLQLLFGNQGDAAATRISYQLDLKGPSRTLLSACSTSLLAVHEACQSLLAGGCDLALAGGASLPVGHRFGYRYEEGSIASPDGHCRPFDAAASGTVFGGGGGLVVLKRLADARRDGDTIHAVVLGSAANNDGADKVGYTAPSVAGQAAVVAEALSFAGVPASSLSYLEAHGTGTRLGDPVEVRALQDVFRAETDTVGACALGSVKSNVGHLDTAAGITGLTKVVLALGHQAIPPSLHFENPNPEIDFATSPFFVAREMAPWMRNGAPRRAGVSSFGIGGTNVHAVVEEAPSLPAGDPLTRDRLMFPLSARSPEALEAATVRLAEHLRQRPELDLADVAYTLGVGRRSFAYRRVVVAANREELLAALAGEAPERVLTAASPTPFGEPEVAFLLSGQGSQHPGMGRELYREEPVFRDALDRAAALLEPELPVPLLELLFPADENDAATARLTRTELAQPALFAFEFALAALWRSWGVTPSALLGHSLGEYVAACLGGTMGFEDALRLVALRGRLMAELPAGGMLAVSLSEEAVRARLEGRSGLALAAVNEPGRVVVAGPHGELAALEEELFEAGVACRSLHTSHAFHSPMMDPILGRFEAAVARVALAPPRLPWVSNLTGTWIQPEQATSAAYWAEHLRGTVRFADGLTCLAESGHHVLLEVGPGNALTSLARATLTSATGPGVSVAASCRHPRETGSDQQAALTAFARLWLAGYPVSFARLHAGERRLRVELPTYPFERRRYWIDPPAEALGQGLASRATADLGVVADATPTPAATPRTRAPEAQGFHPRPALLTPFEPPQDELESTLAGLWQELLGVAPIGRRDSFFELGGHSLLGIQLMSRLKERFGSAPALAEIFEAPLLADFARRMAASGIQPSPKLGALPELEAGVEESTTLSFAEERLWFLARLEPESSAYNLPFALRFEGDLSVAFCRRAFAEVSRRHQPLRTTFHERGGAPVARVWPRRAPDFGVVDLSGLGVEVRDRRAQHLLEIEAVGVFNLERGPLLRVRFLRLAPREHQALLTLHHIVADGWSLGILIKEVTTLYRAFALGEPQPLAELPTTVRDIAARERRTLVGPRLEQQITYWREALRDAPAALELPTDHPRPARASYAAGFANLRLDSARLQQLTSFAEANGSSLFMTLLAGFQAFLGRLTGQRDVLVGSPIAGRDRLESEGLIGLFVNTLVLRSRLEDPNTGRPRSFRDLVAAARDTALAAFAHAELPFEKLVDALEVERSLTHNPIFQALFSLQNAPSGPLELPGLRLVPILSLPDAAMFDLQLTLWKQGSELEGHLEFKRALFDATTVERWSRQLIGLFDAALAAPDTATSDLLLLSAAERQQLQNEWNEPGLLAGEAAPDGLLALLRRFVPRAPDRVALAGADEQISYAELDARAGRLAAGLRAAGVGPEARVAIALERSPRLLIAVLGVLRSGGAYVPIDPAGALERKTAMLTDAAPALLLDETRWAELAAGPARPQRLNGAPPPAEVPEECLAYVLFTSGSTGRPKGVAVPRATLSRFLSAFAVPALMAPEGVLLAVTTLTFDIAGLELLLPLVAGGRVELASAEEAADGRLLAARLEASRATVFQGTPATWQMLLAAGWRQGRHLVALSGGEALPGELASQLTAALGAPGRLLNVYGPTETTVWSAGGPVREEGRAVVAIDRPLAGTHLHVVDGRLRPVPIGVGGEIVIGGEGVARGYLGRPGLTAERFLPDPLGGPGGPPAGSRLYRTGDLARRLADGRLDFLGRLDQQVKVRGFRIEPGEIEAVLARHPEVSQARVVARRDGAGLDGGGEARLVAYWVPRDSPVDDPRRGDARVARVAAGTTPDQRATHASPLQHPDTFRSVGATLVGIAQPGRPPGSPLREFVAERLPEYMVPSAFVELAAFPLNPSGKVDVKALPAPEAERTTFEPPRPGLESEIAALWRELLGVETIGRGDSFFALGGHSLIATRLLVWLRSHLDVDLPLRQVFTTPTLAAFAAAVAAAREPASVAPPAVAAVEVKATAPAPPLTPRQVPPRRELETAGLSFAEERLWFLARLEPESSAYNLPYALRFEGDLSVETCQRAFVEVSRRHQTLRTTFDERDGAPIARVWTHLHPDFGVVDLSGLGVEVRGRRAQHLLEIEAVRVFNLERGPLLRVRFLRLARREHWTLVTLHHIIADGWSLGVLVEELAALYRALALGQPSPLPELPISMRQVAARERKLLAGPHLETLTSFWRQALAGAPAAIELPTDRPRPAVSSYQAGFAPLSFDTAAVRRMASFAEAAGSSVFMVVLAAFQAFLGRLTAQSEVMVGSPIAGRERLETEALIGLFVNTLVLRGRLVDAKSGATRSFRQLVGEARETALAAFSHAEMPFEKLVDELAIERSLTHNPIFQVMFSFQNTPAGALDLPGLRMVPMVTRADAAKFDLQLTLWEQNGGLEGNLEFKRALFDATTVERWCRQLRQLLEAALASPDQPTSRLPWLSAAERHQLREWNDTLRPYPRGVLLDELILEQAARTPEAVALRFEDEALSYGALVQLSGEIAAELVARGVGPGVPVGVRAERSLLLPVELLAVLRAGGAYVPLDPELPEARLSGMVEDARVLVRLAGGLSQGRAGEASSTPRDEGDPAYIIFTSGSTGRPKGAANAHSGIVNRLLWMQEQYGLGAGDRVLQKTPASFDVSVWEFFWPLLTGACLVVAKPGGHRDSGYLARTIGEHRITTLHFVPSMLQAFLEEPDLTGTDAVRRVIASGEALPGELASRAAERIAAPLWNLYGPTEAAVDVTYELAPRTGSGAVPIGRPVANTQVVVLDRALEPCPIGVPGELYLGGIQVGGGYLGRPALTADKFVPDSLTPAAGGQEGEPGRRLYKTGDRVRHLADGRIDFLGRLDFQVKIRGLRIELGEIETALLSHPAVREARVLARPEETGGLRLVAYTVPAQPGHNEPGRPQGSPLRHHDTGRSVGAGLVPALPDGRPQGSPLREFLAERLPEYMIPTAWVELDAFPLNPSGKVDVKALPAPEAERATFEAPRPGLESELAELWRELLRVDKVSRSDSFFALGGHSLMATRLLVRLRSHFGIDLELRQVFNTPTLAALAASLEAARSAATPPIAPEPAVATIEIIPPPPPPSPATTIPRRDPEEVVPLTLAQESLYFLDRFRGGSSLYNIPGAFLLEGRLEVEALAGAFADLVARHESLRSRFVEIDGEGRPLPRPAGESGAFDFRVVDLAALTAAERDRHANSLSQLEGSRPFDLEHGPLLRVTLLRLETSLPAERALLLVVQHHIVSDGWSLGVLVTELVALLAARLEGRENPLPPLPIEISDFACWQRRTLGPEALEAQLAFWRQELAGAPAELELPTDRPRPARLDNRGFIRSFKLSGPALARLDALAAEEGATLFMVLLAAYQALLARWSGQRDLTVGAPVANRSLAELEGLIGFFVNTLVFRGRLDDNPSFRELLRETRTHTFAAFAHPDMPFDRLVEALQPERNSASTPLFQVALSVHNFPYSTPEVAGLKVEALDLTTGNAKFDLALTVARQEVGLSGWLEARHSLFDPTTTDRLLEAFRVLLEAVGHEPERQLAALPLLSPSLRHQLVFEWNDTHADFPAETLVHRLFEARVERAPEATAVAWSGEVFSYAELNTRANRRARQLVALGVGRNGVGEPVALCLERSPELVVAQLAILKAGGAYVPLDLAYPPERLAILLEDSGARVLVTTRELAARFPAWSAAPGHRLLLLDLEPGEDSTNLPAPAGGEATADTLAYLIYTSGSTGRPKGVAVAHRPIVRLVWGADGSRGDSCRTEYCRLTPADRVAQASNTSFDAATFEIWGPLLTGGALIGLDREVTLDPRLLASALAAERVTTLFLTTALFNQVAREEPAAFAGLTHLLFGGEAVDPAWVRRVLASGPPRRLLHVYGPTESTTFSTWTRLVEVPTGASTLPIGGPLSNTTQQVLDAWGAPALPGAVGELVLGGAGLAWGYWQRPATTAERFVPARSSSGQGDRFYRTGDRVRLLTTGGVEFVGRADAQIKLRGFRIELPEIEAALARHPEVGEAVVLVVGDTQADKQLVACLEPRADITPTVAELKAHLALTLPPFMVPAGFLVLPKLPLNPNGKVDRKGLAASLPKNLVDLEREGEAYRPPKTPTEALLAELWADLLAVPRVGVDDNFFALGGHSLLAIRLASRIRQTFEVELPLATLFETANLEELAVAIEASRATGRTALPPIEARPRRQHEPLSFAQERLWFLDQLAPGAPNYNVLAGVRLTGRLAPGAMADALGRLTRRHEALRTVFGARDGQPYQEVLPAAAVPLPAIDLSWLPGGRREAVLRRLVAAESGRGFDLARGPLVRARLVRLADTDHAALLNLHHIVADGWSIDVLTAELGAAMAGEPEPAPLPVQGADVARWQREHLSGAVLAEQIRTWRRLLAEAPTFLPLPTDRPRPPIQSFRGGTVLFRLGAADRDALLALGRREGATLFITLLAAFHALLGRLADQRRLVVGTPIANRSRAELEGLIGLFVNNLALPADLTPDEAGEPGFATLLTRLRPTVLEAYAHADLPFERLVDELAVPRSLAHHPLYQVVFSLLERPPLRLELPGLTLEPLAIDDEAAKLDLQLTVADRPEGLVGTLRYSAELFDATTAQRWARHWQALLRAVAADASVPLAALDLLDQAERSQLLSEWNDTQRLDDAPERLDTLLARQVALRPEALALTAGDESLSYRGLLDAADTLAAKLRAQGSGPERLVALRLPRGLAFVVSVVATFRAGAAYLPLDPGHPADRLAFMLADSGASLAITEDGNSLPASVSGRGFTGGVVAAPSHLAYVIYTSGSTGQPNGVLVPHQAAAALIRSAVAHFGVTSSSRLAQVVSTSFDASVLEIWMALAAGARLILPDEETRRSPTALTHFLNRHVVTTAVLTPAVAALLDRRELPALTSVSVGGESCPAEVANRWAPRGAERSFRLLNCYGPTETAIYAAVLSCRGPFEREPALGRPVAEARIHIVDRSGRLALPGVAGQLVIAGAGLARGYLGRPALTAERFRPDPFAARFGTSGGRIYESGDLARQLADGRLEFLGRLDQQVKIRGLRIELGEVQAACAADPAVAEAVVTATTDRRGDKALTAYLVPVSMSDAAGLGARLRAALAARLPEYMIPSAFVVLPSLPMTPTGKIDRRALPAPEAEEGEVLAPRDLLELTLTRLWAEILDRPAVGIHGNFFALGGHSLLAVRLLARVRQELGAELPLSSLFTAGTVAEMAARIREQGAQGGGTPDPLVRLNRGSQDMGRPLFLVHPAGGDVLCYAALANRLGDRPVYGLKAQGLGAGEGEPLSTLEELAASYLAAVRRLQPTGPYAFGGWSLGGLVAFEMARQASAAGESVELLAVIDTTAGMEAEAESVGADEVGLLLDVAAYVETLWGRPVPMKREDLLALAPEERLEAFVSKLSDAGVLPPGADADTIRRLLKVYAANLEAAWRYQPGTWDGDLLLLPARDRQATDPSSPTNTPTGLLADPTLGWGRLVRHVTVAPVAGHHLSLIAEPQVESLAAELEAALGAQADRELETR